MKRTLALAGMVAVFVAAACTASLATADPVVVDSGSFGIIVGGKRVATETFRMEQRSGENVVTSELKFEDVSVKASQSTEMIVGPEADLRKYTWREIHPSKSQIVVEPQDQQFLVERISSSPTDTPTEVVHPLAPTTSVLDDNFFSHVEVLVWRYLAMSCRGTGGIPCAPGVLKIPVLVPHQQQSMLVTMTFTGIQKLKVKNAEDDYKTFKLETEANDWLLWVDKNNKLVRILIAAENTEVLRD